MNNIIQFDKEGYQAEIDQLQTDINNFKKCIGALEKITGSTELKTLEYVKEFICGLTGFPAVKQSAELLNVGDEYNFLKENLPNVKSDKSEISKKDLELIKEKHTTRLSDELQKEYNTLERITKEYSKLSHFSFINAIRTTDYGVYSIDANNIHQINLMLQR